MTGQYFDGANVMSGMYTGVLKMLQEAIEEDISTTCICSLFQSPIAFSHYPISLLKM